jgi:hypothetical protein
MAESPADLTRNSTPKPPTLDAAMMSFIIIIESSLPGLEFHQQGHELAQFGLRL